MYGIFTYIYHKNQPNVGNIPYMDPMGSWLGMFCSPLFFILFCCVRSPRFFVANIFSTNSGSELQELNLVGGDELGHNGSQG